MNLWIEKAEQLVSAAAIVAITSHEQVIGRHRELESVAPANKLADWDFFMTVAGVGTAFMMIADRVPLAEQKRTCEAVQAALRSKHPEGFAALADFLEFVKRNVDGGIDLPGAIGAWVIWNLKQAAPNDQEAKPAPVLGLFLLQGFARWWDTEQ